MLTVNADEHALMRQFHKQDEEKRMVVILPEDRYQDWLHGDVAQAWALVGCFEAAGMSCAVLP